MEARRGSPERGKQKNEAKLQRGERSRNFYPRMRRGGGGALKRDIGGMLQVVDSMKLKSSQ